MKVRVGVGTGSAPMNGDQLDAVVEELEALGFDSLWWSDVLSVPGDDPLAAMAFAAGRARRLKIGTTMVLPGRNPVRLAKQLATLDQLSGGRLLVTFVLGLRLDGELEAMGVPAERRGAELDEALPLLRRLWTEEGVDHESDRWPLHGITVVPRPYQDPLDLWLGGSASSALRRVGTLADGWLPALLTPEEAAAGRRVVEDAASAAGRSIDPEHFGVSIGYAMTDDGFALRRRAAERRRRVGGPMGRVDADPALLLPTGSTELRRLVERFVDVGFSKFVVRPVRPPTSWHDELQALAEGVLPLQR